MTRTCVYQAFDQTRTLLYVGLSSHWPNRWALHGRKALWWTDIATLTIQWLHTRREAEWLEGYLIRTLTPKYNQRIPEPFEAPHSLSTHCNTCPTGYSASWRPPGSRCEDLSLKPWTEHMSTEQLQDLACHGICVLT